MSPQNKLAVIPKPKKSRKPSARVRGQGSLFLRGEMFWMELNWKGQRYRRSLETDDRETALIKLDAEVAAIRAGELPKRFDPITVQTMFDAFILHTEINCKASTLRDYKMRWNAHLKAEFGSLLATQVTRDKIDAYLLARKKADAALCTRNREQRVLAMIFNYNRTKIPADYYPEFPKMPSEKFHVRKGRLSKEDYDTLRARLEDPKEFWMKVFVTMAFKYGFRRAELINARVRYFDAKVPSFTLPAFTTKSKRERVVILKPDGEIYHMLVKLTEGRDANASLFTRGGLPVKDFRGQWAKLTADIKGGSGKNGMVTVHDLRRSAITAMDRKGITASQAGTHLTPEVFGRYISPNLNEQRENASVIEGD